MPRTAVTYRAIAALGTATYAAEAVVLPNGNALVIGGVSGTATNLYNTQKTSISSAGATSVAHYYSESAMVVDGAIAVGGSAGGANYTAVCDRYTQATGLWAATGSLGTARGRGVAVLLADGNVLMVAGATTGTVALTSCELYTTGTGIWSGTGALATARYQHAAVRLLDNRVLAIGGYVAAATATCEIYDPGTGLWTATGSLVTARHQHAAVVLPDGRVLVAGGRSGGGGSQLASCEIFDPAGGGGVGSWSATGSMAVARYSHTLSIVGGTVIAVGGFGATYIARCEIYNIAAGTWSFGAPLNYARSSHTASVVGGKMLVAGGATSATPSGTTSCELYDPYTNTWDDLSKERVPRVVSRYMRGAVNFTSATGRADHAGSSVFAPGANSWAFAWWHKQPEPFTAAVVVHIRVGAPVTNGMQIVSHSSNVGGIGFYNNNASQLYGSNKFLLPNTWMRIVVVSDRTTGKLSVYSNGVLVSQSGVIALANITGNPVLTLGLNGSTGKMTVSDVQYCISSTPLTLGDVQADYYQGKQLPGCVARWPLDDLAGVTARDVVGGLNLTLAGGAAFTSTAPLTRRTAVT